MEQSFEEVVREQVDHDDYGYHYRMSDYATSREQEAEMEREGKAAIEKSIQAILAAHEADKAQAVAQAAGLPMGVSNWIEHGKKYGYMEFATSQALVDELKMCLSNVPMPTLSYEQVENRIAALSQPVPEEKQ